MGASCEASGFSFLVILDLSEARYLISPDFIDLLWPLDRQTLAYYLLHWINMAHVTVLSLRDEQTLVISLSATCLL